MKYPIINDDTYKSVNKSVNKSDNESVNENINEGGNKISCEIAGATAKSRGSISIEAAMAVSLMSFIAVLFISMLQLASGKSILKLSVLHASDEMARWAPVYRNEVITDMSDKLLSDVGGNILDELADVPFVGSIINARSMYEKAMDSIYVAAAQSLCMNYIENDALIQSGFVHIDSLNLYKSSFFYRGSDDINMTGECSVKTYLPFEIKISYSVRCTAWNSGKMTSASAPETDENENENTDNVWKLDNFTRGKILRQMYGGNLPDSFPVIAAFNDGRAVMIKSMDHTSSSYADSGSFERNIRSMIDSLSAFNGAERAGIKISAGDINIRELILIMPENDMTPAQSASLKSIMLYASSKFILFDLQRYQRV